MPRSKHNHYFKPCPFPEIDVYRVLELFQVINPCLQHAAKKILVAGGRGAGKPIDKDIQEAIDTLVRWQEMRAEEADVPVEIAPPATQHFVSVTPEDLARPLSEWLSGVIVHPTPPADTTT